MTDDRDPTPDDVIAAAERIAPFVHRTPVLTSRQLDEAAGAQVFLKGEHLQRVGAFKYRGATNAVQSLTDDVASCGVAAHSSGNHAQALALAARTRGIPAWLVMPRTSSAAKRTAVEAYGATVVECDSILTAREETLAQVLADTGATEVHPYDDPRVIAGAGTAARELLAEVPDLDVVLVPVGGGGLLSGTSLAVAAGRPSAQVWAAEPALADDAARSLHTGVRQPPLPPTSIADGLLTSLSDRTFRIVRDHVTDIVTVSEDEIVEAMRFVWTRLKQVVEPSGAVPIAALLSGLVPGERIGVIVSGGNVDLDALPWRSAAEQRT